jgi:LacI family transcriptional regulator
MAKNLPVTIQDVAARAGVSAMTVSRVLNTPERVTATTRERIETTIKTLGYTPNALARGLKGATRTLALVIPDVSNPFFTQIVHGAEEVARKHGYTVFLGNTDSSSDNEKHYLHKMLSHRIDGLLIVPMGNHSKKVLEEVHSRGVPFVLIDVKVPDIQADYVVGDNVAGAFTLTEHLIKLGHKCIALVSGRSDLSTSREREEGYLAALKQYNLKFNAKYLIPTDFSRRAGYKAVSSLFNLSQPPTALFVASNVLAIGALEAVRAAGLRVPEDIALVCFEDIGLASALQPFLTVMAQPAKEFGRIGAEFLLRRIAQPHRPFQHEVLVPHLIVRTSCGSQLSGSQNSKMLS